MAVSTKQLFLPLFLFLSFSLVKCEDDDISCPSDDDGDLKEQLNAGDFYNSLSPFQQKFFDNIPSKNFFHKMFNVSFPPNDVQSDYFASCINYSKKMGLNCAISLCDKFGKQSNKAFKKGLDELKYFKVVTKTVENALEQEGNLNSDDAGDLAEMFLQDVGHFLYTSPKDPKAALFALSNGGSNFFKSVGVNGMKDIAFVVKTFGKQFEKSAEDSDQVKTSTQDPLEGVTVEVVTGVVGDLVTLETTNFTVEVVTGVVDNITLAAADDL